MISHMKDGFVDKPNRKLETSINTIITDAKKMGLSPNEVLLYVAGPDHLTDQDLNWTQVAQEIFVSCLAKNKRGQE